MTDNLPAPSTTAPTAIATRETGGIDMQALFLAALDRGAEGAETLERLAGLKEKEDARAAAAAFNGALADFQACCPPVPHSRQGVHGTSYTELQVIAAHIRPHLARHGLSYSFDTTRTDKEQVVTCTVRHRDGHAETTRFTATIDRSARGMNATQQDASAWSYGRRYALLGAFGITTGEAPHVDDDGAAAGAAVVSAEQAQSLREWLAAADLELSRFLGWVGEHLAGRAVASVDDVPAIHYDACVAALRARAERRQGDAHE